MPTIERRVAAAEATLEAFSGRAFAWGAADCVKLSAHVLRGLGYKPRLSRGGSYSSEIGAAKALLRAGFRDTADWMDDVVGAVNRHDALARRLPGDIIGIAHPDMGALTMLAVAVSNGRILAFDPEQVCRVGDLPFGIEGATYMAWSCPPCRS